MPSANTEFHSLWRPSRLQPGARAHLRFMPAQGAPRAELWILHGLSEHGGRYAHVARFFAARGVDVLVPDHPGHGLSRIEGGQRQIPPFGDIVSECDQAVRYWREEAEGHTRVPDTAPRFLIAHSMGALLALAWMRRLGADFVHKRFDRAVLVAPPLKLRLAVPAWKRLLAQAVGRVLPALELDNEIDVRDLAFDPSVQTAASQDALMHGKVTPQLFLSMTAAAEEMRRDPSRCVPIPTLFAVGQADPVVDGDALQDFVGALAAESEFWRVPESRHEVLNDRQKNEVLRRAALWLKI